MKEKTCCFTGHRDIPADKADYLRDEVKKAIEYMMRKGITDFWCGGALGFDTLAAEEVLKLKHNYPEIKLFIAMTSPTQSIAGMKRIKRHMTQLRQKLIRFAPFRINIIKAVCKSVTAL